MARDKWNIDVTHSSITFSVRHLVVAKVRGHFTRFSGSIELDADRLQDSTVAVSIEAASIDTREAQRDTHLKSPDFLDVEKFPTLDFKSTKVEPLDSEHLKVTGDLTIHGVTRSVVLDTQFAGRAKDPWGGERAGFTATTKVDRKDFGLKWNMALEAGGFVVGDTVEISLDVEATKAT
jgi:polyisoprenoid-binding protein YceI